MKKMFVNFKSLGFVALAAAALTFTSCTKEETIKCAEARDDNFESTTLECNPTTTVAKFVANWEVTISGVTPVETYNVKITAASSDYTVTVESNYGLSADAARGAADKDFISPITKNFGVTKDKATFAESFAATGTSSSISNVIFTVNGDNATFTYTLTDDEGSVSYTDSAVKL